MPTARPNVLTRDGSVDPTPFLASSSLYSRSIAQSAAAATLNSPSPGHVDSFRTQGLRQAARFLRRASNSRRMMREPSMVVREAAAQQIEDRQSDWSYSRPVVWLDLAWNMSFVVVAAAVLFFSRDEAPALPLRLWIIGYTCQSLAHVFCVFTEYQRRRRPGSGGGVEPGSSAAGTAAASASIRRGGAEEEQSPLTQHLESANTMFSFVWWMIGFYWICVGGQALQLNAPELYWLCVVFLALDVFFVIFCVALASVVAVAVCCCLPCIIAVLYVLADRGGAAREDVEQLPKYKFQKINGEEKNTGEEINDRGEVSVPSEGMMTECCASSPTLRKLSAEDSECCICLSPYEDGDELRELPCGHHFHCSCIDKWLYINSTCPLCKYDILKRTIREEEV